MGGWARELFRRPGEKAKRFVYDLVTKFNANKSHHFIGIKTALTTGCVMFFNDDEWTAIYFVLRYDKNQSLSTYLLVSFSKCGVLV